MSEILTDSEDKSVYTDKLKELTGKPRRYWGRLPLKALKQIYRKQIHERRVVTREPD